MLYSWKLLYNTLVFETGGKVKLSCWVEALGGSTCQISGRLETSVILLLSRTWS